MRAVNLQDGDGRLRHILGNRDYSTVHSNLQAVDKQVMCDPALESEIEDIIKEVKKM